MASPQNDLLDGIAQLIAGADIATYSTSGVYTPSQTGVFFKIVNPTPDRMVTLTGYVVTDDPSLPVSRMGVQVRFRGTQDPRDVDELGDSVAAVLHGLVNVQFGSVFANQVLRQGSITLGQDVSKRWERADTYYVDLSVPPTINRPDGGYW